MKKFLKRIFWMDKDGFEWIKTHKKTYIILALITLVTTSVMFAIGQGGKLGGFKFSAILLGVVLSVAGLLFISTLLYWSGNLLGGKGTFFEVLIAIIWSNVPLIVYIFLFYYPSLFLLSYIFRTLGNANNAENIFGTIQIFFIAINLYRFLLQIKYVGIAHKISFLRSVVSHLAGILLVIVFSLLGIFFLTISR